MTFDSDGYVIRDLGDRDILILRSADEPDPALVEKIDATIQERNPSWRGVIITTTPDTTFDRIPQVVAAKLYVALRRSFEPKGRKSLRRDLQRERRKRVKAEKELARAREWLLNAQNSSSQYRESLLQM